MLRGWRWTLRKSDQTLMLASVGISGFGVVAVVSGGEPEDKQRKCTFLHVSAPQTRIHQYLEKSHLCHWEWI